jgi:hypothetical protein
MLYLGDRPDAKIIARLTAAAPLEREQGSVNRALPRGRIEILELPLIGGPQRASLTGYGRRNAIAPYGADHAFGDPTRQQIACNWRAIDLTDLMDKRGADFAERSAVREHEHRSRFYGRTASILAPIHAICCARQIP